MRKFITLLIVSALLFVQGAQAEIKYPADSDVTLTMWRVMDVDVNNAGYTSSNDTPAVKNWIAGSGIKFEIKEFADEPSLLLALQADDLPDMFMVNYNSYGGGISGMFNDGLIIEQTPEMLEQNAPDYWAYMNSLDLYLDYIKQIDGKIYNFASLVFEPNSVYRFWQQLTYRGDLLEKYGLSVPTTNEEFKDLLVYARDNIEGIEVPFIGDFPHMNTFTEFGYCSSAYGLVAGREYQVDGVYHQGMYEEAYRDVLRYMNGLYNEGLISVDFASMDQATAQSAFTSGTSIAIFTNNSRMNTLKKAVEEDGGYMVPGGVLHGPDQDAAFYAFVDPYINASFPVFISTESKHPELCLQLLNFLYTDAGNIVRNYGEEGKSFEYVDGVPTYTEYVTKNPDGYSLDAMIRSEALINWPGIHADIMLAQRHPEKTQLDSYKLQEATCKVDDYIVTYTGILDGFVDEYTDLWTDIDAYVRECRSKFISGQMNLEGDFDGYLATLKSMGMDRVIEIKQATLDAFNGK